MAQSQTTFAQALAEHYDELYIEWEKQWLLMSQFAQKRPLPGHRGEVAHFKGYRPFDLVTSPLTQGTAPTVHGAFQVRDITTQVSEWGSTALMSKLLSMTKLDKGLEAQIELVGEQAGRSLDYQMTRELVRNGIWGVSAAGADTSDHVTLTVRSTASNSTSVFVADTAYSNDNGWVGTIATVIRDGNASATGRTTKYGYAGRILTWVSSGTSGDIWTLNTTAPHAAAPEAFQSGDQVRVCKQGRIAATDGLSTALVRRAQRDLKNNRALPFFGRYFAAVVNPDTVFDFAGDTTWVNAGQYSDIGSLWDGEIGKWFGFRFVETTLPGREDSGGTENVTSGALRHNLFLGRNAFGHTELEGGANNKKIYVVTGEDKTDPLDQYTIVGWKQYFANKALTAPWCVSVLTGATV